MRIVRVLLIWIFVWNKPG